MNRRNFFNICLVSPFLGLFGYKSINNKVNNEIPALLQKGEYVISRSCANKLFKRYTIENGTFVTL